MWENEKGELTHFPRIGFLAVAFALTGIYLARYLRPAEEGTGEARASGVPAEAVGLEF